MTTATLQSEIRELKERQSKLEAAFYALWGNRAGAEEEEEMRPEYVRKLKRICKDMDAGRDVMVIRTRQELKQFFRNL